VPKTTPPNKSITKDKSSIKLSTNSTTIKDKKMSPHYQNTQANNSKKNI
jgi:hypothetical protein